jgi:hypothetical protein
VINVAQSTAFEAVYESGVSGLVGQVEVRIDDNDGLTVFGPTAAGIIELGATGAYSAELTAPADLGQYSIIWSNDGSFDPDAGLAVEDLVVLTAAQAAGSLPAIPSEDGGPLYGPCTSWVTTEEIEDCCTLPEASNPAELVPVLEMAAASASQLLFDLSGRQFTGLCQQTVRPCRTGCTCNWQVLSRGYVIPPIWWGGQAWMCEEETPCGCQSISSVKLSGYPVREIVQVKIDGAVVAASEYRLDERRYLVRLNGDLWPGCQDMGVPDTDPGSFSVTYTHGQDPPRMGRDAAAQLACEVYKSCAGSDDCVLPTGARRITRQGITIDATFFSRDSDGAWRTGLHFVDAFLTAVNPHGIRRSAIAWAPGRRFARPAT